MGGGLRARSPSVSKSPALLAGAKTSDFSGGKYVYEKTGGK
jgi:hypothetical protein